MKKSLLILFVLASARLFAQDADVVKKVSLPDGFTEQLNLVYKEVNGWQGKLDLYMPPAANGATPLLINIHGGGWNKGSKETQTSFNTYFKLGFAVANIGYRLTGTATAPAAVEDARCALLYLVHHAKEFNLDVNRIVILGSSSGGHLALMTGYLGNDKKFDNDCNDFKNEKFKIAAVIDRYGITDVWDWAYGKNVTSKSAVSWLGDKAKNEDFAKSVSPLYYVNKNVPPTFIVHGDADPTVPYQQSEVLYKKLQDAGVKSEFMTISGGLHGGFASEQQSEISKNITKFLKGLGFGK